MVAGKLNGVEDNCCALAVSFGKIQPLFDAGESNALPPKGLLQGGFHVADVWSQSTSIPDPNETPEPWPRLVKFVPSLLTWMPNLSGDPKGV